MEHTYGLFVIGWAVIVALILVVQAFWRGYSDPGYVDITGQSICAFVWPIAVVVGLVAGVLTVTEWLGHKYRGDTIEWLGRECRRESRRNTNEPK